MIHEVKCWPEYFEAIITNRKNFEIRKNDRNYREGDILFQREWDPETESYTGREISHEIGFILQGGKFGVEEGFVVLSLNCKEPTKTAKEWKLLGGKVTP